jgi:hypothetical protein
MVAGMGCAIIAYDNKVSSEILLNDLPEAGLHKFFSYIS